MCLLVHKLCNLRLVMLFFIILEAASGLFLNFVKCVVIPLHRYCYWQQAKSSAPQLELKPHTKVGIRSFLRSISSQSLAIRACGLVQWKRRPAPLPQFVAHPILAARLDCCALRTHAKHRIGLCLKAAAGGHLELQCV